MRVVRAVVPAAGLSSRYGGPNKLLTDWHGESMIRATVRALVESGLDVVVVTGRDAGLVAREAGADCAFNPDYATGIGSSLAAGIRACSQCDGFLIALGDMPDLQPTAIKALLSQFEAAPVGAIIAPIYDAEPDRLGHPILFCSSYRPQLEALIGDHGARSIISANEGFVTRVPVAGRLEDIDSPQPP